MNGNNVVLIPALNPSETLIDYVQELISAGFERIVVVDDGSAAENQYIFSELEDNDQVFLLHHAKNYGKGRALKNDFILYSIAGRMILLARGLSLPIRTVSIWQRMFFV